MQLKIKRTCEMKGFVSKSPLFTLNFLVEYSPEEKESINSYNMGGSLLYEKEKLRITIKSLTEGHDIECKDLAELLAQEEEIKGVCKNLKTYLEVSKWFDGREEVVEY